jgi:hypothetical protein
MKKILLYGIDKNRVDIISKIAQSYTGNIHIVKNRELEEKVIDIDYKFTSTWLIEKKMTEEDIKNKKNEFDNLKDNFIRKVETSIESVSHETAGLENIKSEFDRIKFLMPFIKTPQALIEHLLKGVNGEFKYDKPHDGKR